MCVFVYVTDIFVGNLSYNTSSDDVVQHFMKRGVLVKQVRLLTQKGSNRSRGCCFVEFDCVKHQQVSSSDTILDMSILNLCCSPSRYVWVGLLQLYYYCCR